MWILLIAICFLAVLLVASLLVFAAEPTGSIDAHDSDDPGTHDDAEGQWLVDDPTSSPNLLSADPPWTDEPEPEPHSPAPDESDSHFGAFTGHDWGEESDSNW